MGDRKLTFAKQFRIVRILLKWDQTQMAEVFGVARETVVRWESGVQNPRPGIKRLLPILAERNGVVINTEGYPEYAE